MMDRRAFVTGVGAVLAAPLAAEAQPAGKVPRVALLFAATPVTELLGPTPTSLAARGFVEGMRELGWVDGQNVSIERRSADGDPERYLPLVLKMISLKVDVLVVSGGRSLWRPRTKQPGRSRS